MSRRLTKEQFIKKSIVKHDDNYDYSLVEYINDRTPVLIICPSHGEFRQLPNVHYRSGCTECGLLKRTESRKNRIEDLIIKFREKHFDKYDYSEVKYIKMRDKVKIRCKEHDFFFFQSPLKHLDSITGGCKKCNSIGKGVLSEEEFISKSISVHGVKYNYKKTLYKKSNSKVIIECEKHGFFEMTPNSHLMGRGCPSCNRNGSILENKWLDSYKIEKKNRQIKIFNFFVDGLDEKTNTIYEFYGDFWHGNLNKYNKNDINPVNGLTFGQLYKKTIEREKYLKSIGYSIVSIWESDYKKIIKSI